MNQEERVRLIRIAGSIDRHWSHKVREAEREAKATVPFTKKAKYRDDDLKWARDQQYKLMDFDLYWELQNEAHNSFYRPAPINSEILDLVEDGGNKAWQFMTSPFNPALTSNELEDFRSDLLPISVLAASLFGTYELSDWDICKKFKALLAQSSEKPEKFCLFTMETEFVVTEKEIQNFYSSSSKVIIEEKRRASENPDGSYHHFDGGKSHFVDDKAKTALKNMNFEIIDKVFFSRLGFTDAAKNEAEHFGITTVNLQKFIQIYEQRFPNKEPKFK